MWCAWHVVGSFWHVCTCPVGRAVVAMSTPGVVQGLRGRIHLRAQPSEGQMQGLRGSLHLRAQPSEEQVQSLRGRLHLRAQQSEEQMQVAQPLKYLVQSTEVQRFQG